MSHSTLKSYMNDGSQPAASTTDPAPATEPAPAPATEPAPAPEPASVLQPTHRRMLDLILGKVVSRAIAVAAELGIADHLQRGPLGHEELARSTATNATALYRLMRALAAVGVFEEQPARRFANNELSAALLSGVPGSMRNVVLSFAGDASWAAWGGLAHSVESGKAGFDAVFGTDFFSWLVQHPQSTQSFHGAMLELAEAAARAVVEAYDFSTLETIVDVGGGQGTLLALILERHPRLRGVLFDRPEVIAAARKAQAVSQDERITAVGGDFFVSVPSGADAYVMQLVTHDWPDEPCVELLRNCRRSMAAGGRVLIIDAVVSDGPQAAFQKLMDLERLVVTAGRERTEPELRALLARAGLSLARVIPTRAAVSILEAFAS
jgi:SAM-dependent methyltransferase